MVKNFRYEEPGAVALSGAPETPEAVDWLHDQGVRAVVSLHPVSPEVEARMAEWGIAWRPLLITDFASEAPLGMVEALDFARECAESAPGVLIH